MRVVLCFFMVSIALAVHSPEKTRDATPEERARLDLKDPSSTTKIEVVRSKVFAGEEYVVGVDEAEAQRAGLAPEEIRESLREAMDSRKDRKEDGQITITVEKEEPLEKDHLGPPPIRKALVARIRKTVAPKEAYQDSKAPAVRSGIAPGTSIEASGACEAQNRGLLDAVKLPRDPT